MAKRSATRTRRTAAIRLEGAYAYLEQASIRELEACLALDDPSRHFHRAFKEGRWDGKQRLYEGRKFPAGLAEHVTAHLNTAGYDVTRLDWTDTVELDLSRFDAQYLGPIGPLGGDLWDHQVESIRTFLQHDRGIVKAVTGAGKTEMIASVARYLWEEGDYRSLIVVPDIDLLDQTVSRLEGYYEGCPVVGQFGNGVKRLGDIVVATPNTLAAFEGRYRKRRGKASKEYIPPNQEIRAMIKDFEVLFLDEAHHTSSTQWFEIAMFSHARRRYGLSGTPLQGAEIQDLRLIGATGALIHEVPAQVLIDAGLAAKPLITLVMADAASGEPLRKTWATYRNQRTGELHRTERELVYKDAYQEGYVENVAHNRAVVRSVEWLVDRGKQTLVLCRRKDHWQYLKGLLEQTGVDFHAIWGDTEIEARNEAKRQLQNRQTSVVLATTIWDEGTDVPAIDAIVLAEGVKTPINTLQRIGRGMRAKREGANEVWVVDFVPTCHSKLAEHAAIRCDTYEAEGYEVIVQEHWSVEGDDPDLFRFERWDAAYADYRRSL